MTSYEGRLLCVSEVILIKRDYILEFLNTHHKTASGDDKV